MAGTVGKEERPAGAAEALAPDDPIDEARTGASRDLAAFYNRAGGYIRRRAAALGLRPELALGVMFTESGGTPFVEEDGKVLPVLRFEVHQFRRFYIGDREKALAARERALKARKPAKKGLDPAREREKDAIAMEKAEIALRKERFAARFQANGWKSHLFRPAPSAPWEDPHGHRQAGERAALAAAAELDPEAAYRSVSYGMGQIMGFNAGAAGYGSAQEMNAKFSTGGAEQIDAFFRFAANRRAGPKDVERGKGLGLTLSKGDTALQALQGRRFRPFALLYNGPGHVDGYAPEVERNAARFARLLEGAPRRAKGASAPPPPGAPLGAARGGSGGGTAPLSPAYAALREPHAATAPTTAGERSQGFARRLAAKLAPRAFPHDGELTGPFLPGGGDPTKLFVEPGDAERFHAAGSAGERTGYAGSGAIVFVNGVDYAFLRHTKAAQALANATGRPVVEVFNASGAEPGIGASEGYRDWAQSTMDKFGYRSEKTIGNPAVRTVLSLIRRFGDAAAPPQPGRTAQTSGTLALFGHSQGSIIISEAMRLAGKGGARMDRMMVRTFGNAVYTMPDVAAPEGAGYATYKHYVHSHNVVQRDVVSNLVGSVGPGRVLGPVVAALTGSRSASRDTVILGDHPSSSPVAQHGFYEPTEGADYLRDTTADLNRDLAAHDRAFGLPGPGGAPPPTSGPPLGPPPTPAPGGKRGSLRSRRSGRRKPPLSLSRSPFPKAAPFQTPPRLAPGKPFATPLQRAANPGSGGRDLELSSRHDPAELRTSLVRQGGAGAAPDGPLRGELAPFLGFDPGGARLHTGPAAAQAARRLNAEAFTIGRDVFFAAGRFDPASAAGRGLIAHELTHVGQQSGSGGGPARFFSASGGDAMEREAQSVGEVVRANAGGVEGLSVRHFEYEVVGAGDVSESDERRLEGISAMALDEAGRKLRGFRTATALDTVEVEVELDLERMSDPEAARAWADAIVAAVRAKPSTTQRPVAAPTIQRFEGGEHKWLGDTGYEKAVDAYLKAHEGKIDPKLLARLRSNTMARPSDGKGITYGSAVGLSGDFYGTPEALMADRETTFTAGRTNVDKVVEDFVEEQQGVEKGEIGERYPDKNASFVVRSDDFTDLAVKNVPHFAGHNLEAYLKFHGDAIKAALDAHNAADDAEKGRLWDRARFVGAFADHFLTDMFSTGHMRVPREEIAKFFAARKISGERAGLMAKILHDFDNRHGLDVVNPRGDRWHAFGDGSLLADNVKGAKGGDRGQAIALEAETLSVAELVAAFADGTAAPKPGALDLVPSPDPGSPQLSLEDRFGLMTEAQRKEMYEALPWIARKKTGAKREDLDLLIANLKALQDQFHATMATRLKAHPEVPAGTVRSLSGQNPSVAPGEKIRRIVTLLRSWWITDKDVTEIESICATAASQAELDAMRLEIAPMVPPNMVSGRQSKRVLAALSRKVAAVRRSPAPGTPPDGGSDEDAARRVQNRVKNEPPLAKGLTPARIAKMSGREKLLEAAKRFSLGPLIGDCIGVLAVWALLHFTGVGEGMDAAALLYLTVIVGATAAGQFLGYMTSYLVGAWSAKTDEDLTRAGHALSEAVGILGSAAFGGLMARLGKFSPSRGAGKAPSAPKPQTLPANEPIKPFGDLTPQEIARIQAVVDEAGRPLEVVGSAARAGRRGVGTDLPFGKGENMKSDIDYAIPSSSMEHFNAIKASERLPSVDPKHGLPPALHSPYDGPSIRFSPGEPPVFIPKKE